MNGDFVYNRQLKTMDIFISGTRMGYVVYKA